MTYKKDLLMPSVDGRDEMYERMKDVGCDLLKGSAYAFCGWQR